MTLTEGDDIYQSYIQTVHIAVEGREEIPEVENWLKGSGDVIFSTQPDLKQTARIIGAVTFSRHSRNMDLYQADVQFYCEPLKKPLNETTEEITTSGTGIYNPGDVTSKPKIQIRGSGLITITAGGKTITIPECVDKWIVDSETEWITNNAGTPQESACTGQFPVIPKGNSTIQFTGNVTKLIVTPRWRYL